MNNIGEISGGFGFTPIGKIKAKRIKWLIEEILPDGVLAFISGQAKEGKSTFVLRMAISLTRGEYFLNKYKTRRVKILYYSLEDHPGEVKAKAKSMLNGHRFPRKLLMSDAVSISLPADFPRIEQDIKTSQARVVIIDTLKRSHSLDEDSSSQMAHILNSLRLFIRMYKITIIVIHHAGHKIEHRENSGNWLRGTSDYNASWETLIGLNREKSRNYTEVRVFHKYRSSFQISYTVAYSNKIDPHTGDRNIVDLVITDPDAEFHAKDEESVMKVITKEPISGNHLENILKGSLSRPRIDAALNRLWTKGMAKPQGNGKGRKWVLASIGTYGRKDSCIQQPIIDESGHYANPASNTSIIGK